MKFFSHLRIRPQLYPCSRNQGRGIDFPVCRSELCSEEIHHFLTFVRGFCLIQLVAAAFCTINLFICLFAGKSDIKQPMKHSRGGCCAVISHILDSSGGCSSSMPTERLVALGGSQNLNSVEIFNLDLHTWQDMPSTREARKYCTV